ncbi:MAG: ParB/RepB/Spo0J family partition protein [Clostridiales bacterium]|nr:ParB/RepB/Spo0J family partition protein [Clostridiales bacterium]
MAKKGLGKGLDALFGDTIEEYNENNLAKEEKKGLVELKIRDIEPNREQPRKMFDEEKINELAESIKENGLVQPIIVSKDGNRYKIIAGERRWRAARVAGLSTVPVVIREDTLDDKKILELALIENIQRQDLNAIEEAGAIKSLMSEYKMTQEMIAQKIGKSRPAVANLLRLLNLDRRVQDMIIEGRLTETHARAIVVIEDNDLQYDLALEIEKKGLSAREIEAYMRAKKEKKKTQKKENIFAKDLENRIKNYLGTKVKIVTKTKDKGKIVIEYVSNDDLDRIINLLGIQE